jgi:hypothetical protein
MSEISSITQKCKMVNEFTNNVLKTNFQVENFDNKVASNNPNVISNLRMLVESAEGEQYHPLVETFLTLVIDDFEMGNENAVRSTVTHFKNDANGNDHYLHTWHFTAPDGEKLVLSIIMLHHYDNGWYYESSDYNESYNSQNKLISYCDGKLLETDVVISDGFKEGLAGLAGFECDELDLEPGTIFFDANESIKEKRAFLDNASVLIESLTNKLELTS